ncbi:MAG: hypothetical protein LUG83_04990 [Lachnospiraceae bacterium]|nr:hypothetical protein [Lachnospiraceae bacterium]
MNNKIQNNKFEIGFQIMDKWLSIKQRGKDLTIFFADNFINRIALYGIGVLGERFLDEIKDTKIEVAYAIDHMAEFKSIEHVTLYGTEMNEYPHVDAVIVTPTQDYWFIVSLLEGKVSAPVLSLEDIVEYCWNIYIK